MYIIAIDQSTSSTKVLIFNEKLKVVANSHEDHKTYYPQAGWVEQDAEEIYRNTVKAVNEAVSATYEVAHERLDKIKFTMAITNQRETVVVWDKKTGKPVYRAIVWQDNRGAQLCAQLREQGLTDLVKEKTGLLIDPNFSASGVTWILDHVDGARQRAKRGQLLMGTIDTWLIWKLTNGNCFCTDTTNASRTMLFNIHTMTWDDDLLRIFHIPKTMMAKVYPCNAYFGYTSVEKPFEQTVSITGVLGDSHGALVGQMCFETGTGKVTYGTGSSVMVNIGQQPLPAPEGLVTSVAFSAFGKHFYGYEGNIYSTGATLKWMADQLHLVSHPSEMEKEATSVDSTEGVYVVPAFAGLGAPWWKPDAKGAIVGMTFATTRAHVVRAALESIAYQVRDLVGVMAQATGGQMKELCADGGPTKNQFLMQYQADQLATSIVCTEVEDASALGAAIMSGFTLHLWDSPEDVMALRSVKQTFLPQPRDDGDRHYQGWLNAVRTIVGRNNEE